MDNKYYGFLSFLFLLVLPAMVLAFPTWQDNIVTQANGTDYNNATSFGFQINCSDNATSVVHANYTGVTFRIGTPTGVFLNYSNASIINYSTIFMGGNKSFIANNSVGTFWINISQISMGKAGTYNYTWFCVNESALQNATTATDYYIDKNTTGSGIDQWLITYYYGAIKYETVNANNVTYEGQGNPYANCTRKDISEGTSNMYRNGTAWTQNTATALGAGPYDVKCNITGNANFTNNETGSTYELIVFESGGGGGGGSSGRPPSPIKYEPSKPSPTYTAPAPTMSVVDKFKKSAEENPIMLIAVLALGLMILSGKKR